MRLFDVQQALQSFLDQQDHVADVDLPVPRLRSLSEHRLHAAIDPGQADPGSGVEAPSGRLGPGEDVDGPVRDLDHGARVARLP